MKFDKEHIEPLIQALTEGQGRVRACKAGGIEYQTFLNWIETKVEFFELVKKAEATGSDRIKDIVKRRIIEDKSWQSAAWWLERNFPDEFKNRTETKQTVTVEDVTGEILKRLESDGQQ